MPGFAFDYLDGAIDEERGKWRNREAWHEVVLTPRYLRDVSDTDLTVRLFGHDYSLPFGVPPVGLGNMLWPGAEMALANAARAGEYSVYSQHFQHHRTGKNRPVRARGMLVSVIFPCKSRGHAGFAGRRVKQAGYRVLVVTLDIPVGAKRNRELRNGLKLPFSLTPNLLWQGLIHPAWALQTALRRAAGFCQLWRATGRARTRGCHSSSPISTCPE